MLSIKKKSLIFDFIILFLVLILIIFRIGSYGLYEPHEGHFAMVAKEMILRKDWITPYLNGAPYLNKPPLLYWLIATSIKIFGETEFAVRLPLALSGWLAIIIAWLWTRQLWGITASRIVILLFSVTTGWFIFTHQLLIDVLLATILLVSNYCLWKIINQPNWLYFFSFYLCLGLALLTKGLIGIILPLVGLFGLIIMTRDYKILSQIKLGQGILIILAVTLPWFIAVEQANPGFLHYFIINEHLDRIFDRRFPPDYEVSKISAWGYLGITAIWCLPWVIFLPGIIKFTWQQYQTKHQSAVLLIAIAFSLPILVFLPLSSRLIYYSIPAIPPYLILSAGYFSSLLKRQNYLSVKSLTISDRLLKSSGLIAILIGIICLGTLVVVPQLFTLLPKINARTINYLIITVLIVLGTGFLITGIAIIKKLFLLSLISLWLAWTLTYFGVTNGFVFYQDLRSSKTLIQTANHCLLSNTLWVFEGSREIGAAGAMSFYLNQNQNQSQPIFNQAGWVTTNQGNSYRIVMVLADGGNNRLPPHFPGELPSYLITKAQLQSYWQSDRSVVFVTDFLRQPNDPNDPNDLNLPQDSSKPLLEIGSRKLYGNAITRKKWCKSNF